MDSISQSMANLRLPGMNRSFNSGIGSSIESVRSRYERQYLEGLLNSDLDHDHDEEDFTGYCNYCCVSDDRCQLLSSSDSSNQTSESDFSHVDSRYENPHVDPRYIGHSNVMYKLAFFNTLTNSDIARLAMCKEGCSYFHNMLDQHDPNIRKKIVTAVNENLFKLMVNLHGNILFQFILETSSFHEFKLIFAKMAESLIIESNTDYGSSSVLKLIRDFRQSPFIRLIASALAEGVYTLMTNYRGRKVIHKCFSLIASHKREKLSEAVAQHCIKLSTHVMGCTSLQECLEFITGPPRDHLLDTITHNSLFLAQHPKGNYVLQHVLELRNPIINDKICSLLFGHYVHLSCIKIGSHVVEACLGTSGMHYVIEEFLARKKILQLAQDEYGNYVIQTALSKTQVNAPLTHGIILSHLIQNIPSLKQHPFGKIVCTFITENYPAALE